MTRQVRRNPPRARDPYGTGPLGSWLAPTLSVVGLLLIGIVTLNLLQGQVPFGIGGRGNGNGNGDGNGQDPTRTAGTRRKLEVTVDVSITQPAEGKVLFKKIFSASGEYAEGSEVTGRREAFVKVVNDMIQGVQSQW